MSRRIRRLLMSGAATCAGLAFAAKAADGILAPDELSEADRVDARVAAARERIALNQALENDLAEDRVGLWEAADRLLAVNADDRGHRTVLEAYFPGPTLEASAAANLICRVDGRLREDPVARRRLVRRLLAEYRARHGEPAGEWLRHLNPNSTAPDGSSPTEPDR